MPRIFCIFISRILHDIFIAFRDSLAHKYIGCKYRKPFSEKHRNCAATLENMMFTHAGVRIFVFKSHATLSQIH